MVNDKLKICSLMAGVECDNGFLAIGNETGLPWHCPDDMKIFKTQTLGRTCIVSMKTLATIPNMLRGRSVIAITTDPSKYGYTHDSLFDIAPWVTIVDSKEKVFSILKDQGTTEAIVIGGAEIYDMFKNDISIKVIAMLPSTVMNSTPTVFMSKPIETPYNVIKYRNNLIHYYFLPEVR